jgi:glycosyltransferase involved in cell wall biosynthesis
LKSLILSSLYNFTSGYKVILDCLLNDCFSDHILNKKSYAEVDEEYEKYFEDLPPYKDCLELILSPPCNGLNEGNFFYRLAPSKNRIIFTMWESTRIYDIFIEIANQQRAIIVPNQWNKDNFTHQGVTVPIHVVPLFVDDYFNYSEPKDKDYFVFGTANGDERKRIEDVCKCFIKAFPKQKNVKLNVKVSSLDDTQCKFTDSRINFIKKDYSLESLKEWYCCNDVFVSCVAAEGWGLMQHESMACGRPVIAANYAGLSEFMTKDNSFPVDFSEVPSKGYWKNPGGKWSKYDEEHMIETMRYCYNNPEKVKRKGVLASSDALKLSKLNFIKNIRKTISIYQ